MKFRASISFVLSGIFVGFFIATDTASAQVKSQPTYVSKVDQELNLQRVAVSPITDNLSGIYAGPLTAHLKSRLSMDPRWTVIELKNASSIEASPAEVRETLKAQSADALLTGRVQKGPAGIQIRLALYVGSSGLPLLIEESLEPRQFSTERMIAVLDETLQRLRDRLPFHGIVASRRGQQVTLNLGKNSGLRDGDEVDIIQILRVNRHPKLQFMISTDKEILGKARIFKADEELSFANISYEKEPNVVVQGQKVLASRPILYATPGLENKSFGDKPVEWLPEPDPQYGRVQIMAGLGQYSQTNNFATEGGVSGNNSLTPNLGIMGEGWLNRDWWVGFNIRQSAFSVNNGYANSSPGKINMSIAKYDIAGGYNFLLGNDFFGPKLQISLGLSKFDARADESTPLVFANSSYGGTYLGFTFNTNLGEGSPYDLGAKLKYFISPNGSESGDSGSMGSIGANDFSFLLAKRVRNNFRYVSELNFEYYNADFNGNGSRPDRLTSNSHRATTLWLGLEYAF